MPPRRCVRTGRPASPPRAPRRRRSAPPPSPSPWRSSPSKRRCRPYSIFPGGCARDLVLLLAPEVRVRVRRPAAHDLVHELRDVDVAVAVAVHLPVERLRQPRAERDAVRAQAPEELGVGDAVLRRPGALAELDPAPQQAVGPALEALDDRAAELRQSGRGRQRVVGLVDDHGLGLLFSGNISRALDLLLGLGAVVRVRHGAPAAHDVVDELLDVDRAVAVRVHAVEQVPRDGLRERQPVAPQAPAELGEGDAVLGRARARAEEHPAPHQAVRPAGHLHGDLAPQM